MKKCSIFLAIKEMQIKTMLRVHLNPLEWLPSRIPPTTNVDKNIGKRNLHTLLSTMESVIKLKIELPCDPAIPLLGWSKRFLAPVTTEPNKG
jgi:hypothetical protein